MNRNSGVGGSENSEQVEPSMISILSSSFKKLLFQNSSQKFADNDGKKSNSEGSRNFEGMTPQRRASSNHVPFSSSNTPTKSESFITSTPQKEKLKSGLRDDTTTKKMDTRLSEVSPHALENEEALFSPSFHLDKEIEASDEDFQKYLERVSDIEDDDEDDDNVDNVSVSVKGKRYQEHRQYTYHYPSHYLENEFNPFVFIRNLPKLEHVLKNIAPRNLGLPKKTRSSPPITLVLDLDETLVHCSTSYLENSDLTFKVDFNGEIYTVHVRKRPHLYEFLESVSKIFEVVIFTASQRLYADTLLNILDPEKKYIKDSCLCVNGNYMKDLTILGRDLRKVVIVDNAPQAFGFQISNGIPIESWYDDPHDSQLLEIRDFLETLLDLNDVRPVLNETFRLNELISSLPILSHKIE